MSGNHYNAYYKSRKLRRIDKVGVRRNIYASRCGWNIREYYAMWLVKLRLLIFAFLVHNVINIFTPA